jgi:hypothetical protein
MQIISLKCDNATRDLSNSPDKNSNTHNSLQLHAENTCRVLVRCGIDMSGTIGQVAFMKIDLKFMAIHRMLSMLPFFSSFSIHPIFIH